MQLLNLFKGKKLEILFTSIYSRPTTNLNYDFVTQESNPNQSNQIKTNTVVFKQALQIHDWWWWCCWSDWFSSDRRHFHTKLNVQFSVFPLLYVYVSYTSYIFIQDTFIIWKACVNESRWALLSQFERTPHRVTWQLDVNHQPSFPWWHVDDDNELVESGSFLIQHFQRFCGCRFYWFISW